MCILYAYKLSLKVSSKCIHPNYYFYCFECVHRVCPNLLSAPCILPNSLTIFLSYEEPFCQIHSKWYFPKGHWTRDTTTYFKVVVAWKPTTFFWMKNWITEPPCCCWEFIELGNMWLNHCLHTRPDHKHRLWQTLQPIL